MATMTFQAGRLALREDRVIVEQADAQGVRTFTLKGQESRPRLSAATVRTRREDVLGMVGSFVPLVFTRQSTLNGYYRVTDATGEIEDIGDGLVMFRWTLTVAWAGTPTQIDLESRLSGPQTRSNVFTALGERSHAPAAGASGYWVGSAAPGSVERPCTDGTPVRVYRALPLAANPRWVVSPGGYGAGRCRLLDATGQERAGTQFRLDPLLAWPAWELSNGVLRVRPDNGPATFRVGVWNGTAWEEIVWLVRLNDPWENVQFFNELSVLRNEYDTITLRLLRSFATVGRLHLDLTLRRGARVAEVYVTTSFSTRLGIVRFSGAASTATSGYVVASANDADGNRSVIGSALTFTADTLNGGIEKTGTRTLDAMLGVVYDGGAAVAGDTAADLYAQYLGMPSEVVVGVRR